jgi:uncharacterized protein with NAD-binding domain and iron-sulfur cluster
MAPQKRRIAVLGGGIGGLSTAYEIACKQPDCEITVFEMSWRLGGKCASQRNPEIAQRNEEHGIHVLFGCYENAFHLIRRVYADLGLDWKATFLGQSDFTLFDQGSGDWKRWDFSLPKRPKDPGDWFESPSSFPSIGEIAKRVLEWVWHHIFEHASRALPPGRLEELRPPVKKMLDRLDGEPAAAAFKEALEDLQQIYCRFGQLSLVEVELHTPAAGHADRLKLPEPLRKLRVLAELGCAASAGLLHAKVAGRTLYDLNDRDLTQWLKEHALGGLSAMAEQSGALRMIYEASFAFEDGDPGRRNFAAGTAAYVMYRMLIDYHGYLSYKMKNGTSEALITPLYRALQRRNVRFAFFHRVDEIVLDGDQRNIAAVRFSVQSRASNGDYDPLVEGTDSWPSRPKYALLENGNVLDKSDELVPRGFDLEDPRTAAPSFKSYEIVWRKAGGTGEACFDDVVLAIPPAASQRACKALEQSNLVGKRWQQMYKKVKHAPTQACQIWFDRTAEDLGWTSAGSSALVGCYEQSFSNWADYSCVVPSEQWPVDVRSVAYLCGCLMEIGDLKSFNPARWRESVRNNAETWLQRYAKTLWPALFSSGKLDWDRLVDLHGKTGKERLAEQFFRANLSLSGRYVLSVKNSFTHRMAAWESGFDNLFLAGDWTRNGADNGCVEATVMSARRAARAILGLRRGDFPVYGEGD